MLDAGAPLRRHLLIALDESAGPASLLTRALSLDPRVVTTFIGHGLLNLAASYVPLFTLNLVIVLEPAIAIALGVLLFGATVNRAQAAGGAILIAAVLVGLRAGGQPAPPQE